MTLYDLKLFLDDDTLIKDASLGGYLILNDLDENYLKTHNVLKIIADNYHIIVSVEAMRICDMYPENLMKIYPFTMVSCRNGNCKYIQEGFCMKRYILIDDDECKSYKSN